MASVHCHAHVLSLFCMLAAPLHFLLHAGKRVVVLEVSIKAVCVRVLCVACYVLRSTRNMQDNMQHVLVLTSRHLALHRTHHTAPVHNHSQHHNTVPAARLRPDRPRCW